MARKEISRLMASLSNSYDEEAEADVVLAASLYDPHRFREMEQILDPWNDRVIADPKIVSPMTRIMIFNTLARARVITGRGGWDELFRRSETILIDWEPTELSRTRSYLAHSLLRSGRMDDAEEVIAQIASDPGLGTLTRWFLGFLQAELSRKRGTTWISDEMENRTQNTRSLGHPFGFYFQATARQPGRNPDDVVSRFRRAAECFSVDTLHVPRHNIQCFLADCMRLAESAWSHDPYLWKATLTSLARHLSPRPAVQLAEHYREQIEALGPDANQSAVEALLTRVPYS
jgi:hypothetical protein